MILNRSYDVKVLFPTNPIEFREVFVVFIGHFRKFNPLTSKG